MSKKLNLICLRGILGDWIYYSSMMSAEQIKEWVKPSKDIREAKSLDEILQRDLKERKKDIAKYLLNENSRFFSSIVIGVFGGLPKWYEFSLKSNPNIDISIDTDDYTNSIGILSFEGNEKMFAIDGQHRVAGIAIAYDEIIKKNKKNQFLDDQYPVLFLAHIDDELGKKRTRKLFSDINKKAKPVAQGDRIKIDEEDLIAITTRRIYATYPYFQNGKLISLTENAKLEQKDTSNFTNLLGLYNLIKVLSKLFNPQKSIQLWDEANIVTLKSIVECFFDFIIENVNEYKSYFIDNTLSIEKARKDNKYLLFRPIGLVLLGKLYVHFFENLDYLKEVINKIGFIFPESPLNNVVWNNGRMEAKSSNQNIAFKLVLYILNQLNDNEENNLLNQYRILLKNEHLNLPNKL